jgi:hypothetical protein
VAVGILCLAGAIWRLFSRDDLEIDLVHHYYVRRLGQWPRVHLQQGPLDDITAVEVTSEHPQDSRGGELDVWTVGLRFKNATELLLVAEFLNSEQRARHLAASLASRLQLSFRNQSGP